MKIGEKIRELLRRQPLTAEQLAARIEAAAVREQMLEIRGKADIATQKDRI